VAIRPTSDPLDSAYCSKECQIKAKSQSQNLLFSVESPLPSEMGQPMPPQALEERRKAQIMYVKYLKKVARAAPELVARFIARQVALETANMVQDSPVTVSSDLPEADGARYTLYDHIEQLRYLEVVAPEEEMKLLCGVLQTALPGLEQFVTSERHATLLGKMGYNMYGVCFGGGRDDKVSVRRDYIRGHSYMSVLPASLHRTSRGCRENPHASRHFSPNRQCILQRIFIRECLKNVLLNQLTSHPFRFHIHAHQAPPLPSAMALPNSTLSLTPPSKPATKSLSHMWTLPSTQVSLLSTRGNADGWNLHAVGDLRVHVQGARKMGQVKLMVWIMMSHHRGTSRELRQYSLVSRVSRLRNLMSRYVYQTSQSCGERIGVYIAHMHPT
jgi:hypothetical protein